MLGILKILAFTVVFFFLVVVGYAFFGNLSAPLDSFSEPVQIEAK